MTAMLLELTPTSLENAGRKVLNVLITRSLSLRLVRCAPRAGSSPISDILTSPLGKAVLAGIAAMVVKRVTGPSQTT